MDNNWISVVDQEPTEEKYYEVKFDDGSTDNKPFRIRPKQNIRGFMTEKNVTHWREENPEDWALPID